MFGQIRLKTKDIHNYSSREIRNVLNDEERKFIAHVARENNVSWGAAAVWVSTGVFPDPGYVECICGKKMFLKDYNTTKIPKSCSYSCEQKRRRQVDSSYQKNIVNKTLITKSEIDSETGLTGFEISAINSAKSKRLNGGYDKFKATMTRKLSERKHTFKLRLHALVTKYGAFTVFRRLYVKQFGDRDVLFSTILRKYNEVSEFLELSLDFSPELFYCIVVKKLPPIGVCCICDSQFSRYGAVNSKFYFTNRKTCSDSCHAKLVSQNIDSSQRSSYMTNKWSNPEYREFMVAIRYARTLLPTAKETERRRAEKSLLTMRSSGTLELRRDKSLETKLARGLISGIYHNSISQEKREYLNYKKKVFEETKRHNLMVLENFEYRSKHGYHLDHIFPISMGYFYKIPPELIGHIDNLQMLHCDVNRKKSNNIILIPQHISEFIERNNITLYER